MGNQALQALSVQYIRGEISKPEYRQQRKQIIDEATGFVETIAEPDSDPEVVRQTDTSAPNSSQPTPLLKVGVISVIIIAIIAILYTAM